MTELTEAALRRIARDETRLVVELVEGHLIELLDLLTEILAPEDPVREVLAHRASRARFRDVVCERIELLRDRDERRDQVRQEDERLDSGVVGSDAFLRGYQVLLEHGDRAHDLDPSDLAHQSSPLRSGPEDAPSDVPAAIVAETTGTPPGVGESAGAVVTKAPALTPNLGESVRGLLDRVESRRELDDRGTGRHEEVGEHRRLGVDVCDVTHPGSVGCVGVVEASRERLDGGEKLFLGGHGAEPTDPVARAEGGGQS